MAGVIGRPGIDRDDIPSDLADMGLTQLGDNVSSFGGARQGGPSAGGAFGPGETAAPHS
jgi:hypothetical protein